MTKRMMMKKINFILLSKIGKTTQPNKYKISINELKKVFLIYCSILISKA